MRKTILVTTFASALAITGCENLTRDEQLLVGGLTGVTIGLITAKAFDADSGWTLIAALAGATAGTLVARNQADQTCAYAVGDGTYRVVRC